MRFVESSSYAQILKSSSIIGGAQGINYVIGLLRTKIVALILGPSGIGLVGLYVSAGELVGTLAGLGIAQSGVREVAEAHGSGDASRIAHTVKTVRRACWVTGILGWLLISVLSYPISSWIFSSGNRAWSVAALGAALMLNAIYGGRIALIQGTRRIGDLARASVMSAFASMSLAIGMYAVFQERGIVPVLILTAAVNLTFAWWFARRVKTAHVSQTWTETVANSKRLISLGVAFMYGALLAAFLGFAIRAMIVRKLGLEANGIYQAAWAVSGMFAGFILSAMGTDFYPRLTAVSHDDKQVNHLVNEQIEIGILLALPGILGTLSFAPWVVHIFYSVEFLPSAVLLPWLALGIFGQVITFPLGFIQRAKGRAGWIFVSQTHLNLLNGVLALVMIPTYGVIAAAWAFTISTYLHGLVVFGIARRLSQFALTMPSARLVLAATWFIGTGFAAQMLTDGLGELFLGVAITGTACFFSLRGITSRLGYSHRIVTLLLKIPGARFACRL